MAEKQQNWIHIWVWLYSKLAPFPRNHYLLHAQNKSFRNEKSINALNPQYEISHQHKHTVILPTICLHGKRQLLKSFFAQDDPTLGRKGILNVLVASSSSSPSSLPGNIYTQRVHLIPAPSGRIHFWTCRDFWNHQCSSAQFKLQLLVFFSSEPTSVFRPWVSFKTPAAAGRNGMLIHYRW